LVLFITAIIDSNLFWGNNEKILSCYFDCRCPGDSDRRRLWPVYGAEANCRKHLQLRQPLPDEPGKPLQLTNGDYDEGGVVWTHDGSRIYFGEGTLGSYRIMQVAATGGPAAIIPTRLANFQFSAVSQDGASAGRCGRPVRA